MCAATMFWMRSSGAGPRSGRRAALGYRARLGIRPAEVAIAVVVQELVPADVAGVLFTANPLTGARDQVVVSAAWGLGEAIVGGQVTPDTYIVNRQTEAIESREIADKEVMTVRLPAGTRRKPSLTNSDATRARARRRSWSSRTSAIGSSDFSTYP